MAVDQDKPLGGRGAALLAAAAGGLLLAAFAGIVPLNKLLEAPYRSYGAIWRDQISVEETILLAAIVFLATPAAILLTRALFTRAGAFFERLVRVAVRREKTLLAVCLLGALGATVAGGTLLHHSPITDEEQTLVFQADLLRSGRLQAREPALLRGLEPPGVWVRDGQWTADGQWGHAAVLAAGRAAGSPFLFPHLSAPLLILLAWLLARELFAADRAARAATVALLATSPYLVFTAATLNPATSSALAVLAGAWTLARHARGGSFVWAVLAGLAFGFDLHVRPVNGAVLGGVCAGLALAARLAQRRSILPTVIGFLAGVAPWLVLHWLLHRQGFTTQLPMAPDTATLAALGRSVTDLLRFALWATGSVLAAAIVLGPRRDRHDWFLLAPVAALFAATIGWDRPPEAEMGPAAYLDVLPFFLLFVARSLSAASSRLTGAARRALLVGLPVVTVVAMGTWWPVQGAALAAAGESVARPYELVDRIGLPKAVVLWAPAQPPESWVTQPRTPSPEVEQVIFIPIDQTDWLERVLDGKRHLQGRRPFSLLQSWGTTALLSWKVPPDPFYEGGVCLDPGESLPDELQSPLLR